MPSSFSRFTLNGLLISRIRRIIPKQWNRSPIQVDVQNNAEDSLSETLLSSDESMIESLFISLKEFANQGQLLKAFRAFSLIQLHVSNSAPIELILHPISSLLLSCSNLGSLPQGKQLHAHIISLGLEQHPILVPKLVTFYSTFSLLVDARIVTENSSILHPLPWNLLISCYVKNGLCKEAIMAYRKMLNKGIRPDNHTYPSVLKACGEESDLAVGREVHKSINASCLQWCVFVHNALISMYGRVGEVDVARSLFDIMPERDVVSWNTMISNYSSKGMWKEAFELFENMRAEGIELNAIIWNTIAAGCLRTGNFKKALKLISQMGIFIRLDYVAIIIGLSACSYGGVINLGKEIHCFAIRSCCDGFDNVRHALITMYSRCKELRHSYILFQMTEPKSIITWNSLLSGYTHLDEYEEASFLFREMLLSGMEPNYVTIASILPLCARVANLQHGKEFHCYILRHEGFKDFLLLWNALVDMYGRSGKVIEANRVFNSLSRRDEVTYTSLIAGYGMRGEGQAALELFEEMNRFQIKPDHITMVAILSACSHSGLVTQGEMLLERMSSVYGITPHLQHFACMVDLYGRASLLYKARDIITRMPYNPTAAMWATLLGACRIHGNTDIGEWAAEKLLEMRPDNSGYYVLIANMYAAAGCWNKLAEVRTFMRDLGVQKAPGCAWVDLGNRFSPFLVGDTSNPLAHEIYPLLDGLAEQIKDAGHLVSEGFGLNDEVLEDRMS